VVTAFFLPTRERQRLEQQGSSSSADQRATNAPATRRLERLDILGAG
jgi:hypothetical protein